MTKDHVVSNRRKLVRKILGVAAVGGASALLFGSQVKEVKAILGGNGANGEVAYWASSGTLAGFGLWNPGNSSLALSNGSNSASASGATVGGGNTNFANGISSNRMAVPCSRPAAHSAALRHV